MSKRQSKYFSNEAQDREDIFFNVFYTQILCIGHKTSSTFLVYLEDLGWAVEKGCWRLETEESRMEDIR